MNKYFIFALLILCFTSCTPQQRPTDTVVSMQMVDRNGFSETISNPDRLKVYKNVDFLTSQPYRQVLRVYVKDDEGKSHSKLTSYHTNGGIWQYLEAIDGRANGRYLEWHENGKVKIEATVIEGLADLSELAQKSWLFDKECSVWNEEGTLIAFFQYSRGNLDKDSKYYYPSGKLEKVIPYNNGLAHGVMKAFDEQGALVEQINFQNGLKESTASAYWSPESIKYEEDYKQGLLFKAAYFDPSGKKVAEIENGKGVRAEFQDNKLHSLIEYDGGEIKGLVRLFNADGKMYTCYEIKEGKKVGAEWQYYLNHSEKSLPKLMISWFDNKIQGMVKTWYENGILESEREMSNNKKHGLSFAYYKTGELMLMEEYENDKLVKGSYFKKGEQIPTSMIEHGDGTATLYHSDGNFLSKIKYEKSKPIIE